MVSIACVSACGAITRTTFRVHGEAALRYWEGRLREHGIAHSGIVTRDERLHLDFEDPQGLSASLVDDGGVGEAHPWEGSPVPAEHQIRGLGYGVVTVPELAPTHAFLTGVLNLEPERMARRFSDALGDIVECREGAGNTARLERQ